MSRAAALVTGLALVVVAACGGGDKRAATAEPAPAAPATRSAYAELEARIPAIVAAMDQLARDLTAVEHDCPKIAAVLRMWGSRHAVELDAMWELKNQLTPAEQERYAHEHADDANRIAPVFAAAMTGCEGDPEVQDALTVAGFRRVESLQRP